MFSPCSVSRTLSRRIGLAATMIAVASFSLAAMAQDAPQTGTVRIDTGQMQTDGGSNFSSSTANLNTEALLGGAPAIPAASASPQYGGGNYPRYPQYQNRWSHLAFEGGAGFTAPVGNTTHGNETYGYNVNVGAGWNFTKRFGLLLEYEWNRDKIPGSTLTGLFNATQASCGDCLSSYLGGNVNNWGFALQPIIYQPLSKKTGVYVTGGGGFYRKVTNFTQLEESEECYYFCYVGYAPSTIAHSSSNQGGLNIGVGYYWKAFGEDSKAKLYAEARYKWINSPVASNSDPYGSGTESLIPVTLGIRF
jgi:hypothetical protein